MKILIPVSRFRVTYEIAAGSPYSRFEALVLKAVEQGAKSIEELRVIFAIHPRLLIDALVTLTQAGWLAAGGDDSAAFVLTAEGEAAVRQASVPPSLSVKKRYARLVLERLTGGLANNDEVTFVTNKNLGKTRDEWVDLPVQVGDNSLSEGQVYPFLPCREKEWIRWIGPIDMLTKGSTWLPANVDLDRAAVIGLPDAWHTRLKSLVLEIVADLAPRVDSDLRGEMAMLPPSRRRYLEEEPQRARRLGQVCWPVTRETLDWMFNRGQHLKFLEEALGRAKSTVFVGSSLLSRSGVEHLKPLLLAALARGVSIDALWGTTDESDGYEALKGVAYAGRQERLAGSLSYNTEPSQSAADVVIIDGNEFSSGSFPWLSDNYIPKSEGDNEFFASVICRDKAITAALIHCVAALWAEAPKGRLSAAPDKWRRIASEIERVLVSQNKTATDGASTVRLVINREHDAVGRDAVIGAQVRLVVGSVFMSDAVLAGVRTVLSERRSIRDFTFVVGALLENDNQARIADAVMRAGGRMRRVPSWRASAILSDDWVCVSSSDARVAAPAIGPKRIGIVVEGAQAVAPLRDELQRLFASPS